MTIRLTEKQLEALRRDRRSPISVVDPRTNTLWYLIPASEYQTVQEILEDDRQQKAIRAVGLRNAAKGAH
jgi:hypothetical protein